MESWPAGRIAVLMPPVPDHLASPHPLDLYEKRLRANLEGVCPECAAVVQLPNRHERRRAKARGEPANASMEHESWCPVGDEGFRQAIITGMN
jgi:hypothetical protein